jgi:hypothetical protein
VRIAAQARKLPLFGPKTEDRPSRAAKQSLVAAFNALATAPAQRCGKTQ